MVDLCDRIAARTVALRVQAAYSFEGSWPHPTATDVDYYRRSGLFRSERRKGDGRHVVPGRCASSSVCRKTRPGDADITAGDSGDWREALCSNVDDIPIGRFRRAPLSTGRHTCPLTLDCREKYAPITTRERRAEHRERVPNTRLANRRREWRPAPGGSARTLQTGPQCIDAAT